MENLEIYNKYRNVPSEALKNFDNGKFKGTDINSMWRIKCLTEQFGVVGFGWTTRVLRTWTEQVANDEILAFAEIEMKVKINGEWGEPFTATGGNKMVKYVRSGGYLDNSDEAYKMAITDAFGVACKYLGIGADVYFANDKSKYTENNEQGSKNGEKRQKANDIKEDIDKVQKEPIKANNSLIPNDEDIYNQAINFEVNGANGVNYKLGQLRTIQLEKIISSDVASEKLKDYSKIILEWRNKNV